jgi:hypothetical protein
MDLCATCYAGGVKPMGEHTEDHEMVHLMWGACFFTSSMTFFSWNAITGSNATSVQHSLWAHAFTVLFVKTLICALAARSLVTIQLGKNSGLCSFCCLILYLFFRHTADHPVIKYPLTKCRSCDSNCPK